MSENKGNVDTKVYFPLKDGIYFKTEHPLLCNTKDSDINKFKKLNNKRVHTINGRGYKLHDKFGLNQYFNVYYS